jgi:hypothetical protein
MLQDRGQERAKKMMLVKIEPDEISSVVSRELQQLYEYVKEDKDFVVDAGLDTTQKELMRVLTTLIEYYTIPSEFDVWKEHDA